MRQIPYTYDVEQPTFASDVAQPVFACELSQVAAFDLVRIGAAVVVTHNGEVVTHRGDPIWAFAPDGVTVAELTAILAELGIGAGALALAEQTPANKSMPARATASDGDLACNVAVTYQPAPGAYVGVIVSGLRAAVGDGATTGCDCYFSGDGGAHARAQGQIQQGDTLHWIGSVAGFQLAPTDVIDFVYERG